MELVVLGGRQQTARLALFTERSPHTLLLPESPLLCLNRDSDELLLTQEFIATMLGVRQAGVTQMAQKLQERTLIQYHRGHVQILNQAGLETSACGCFKTVKAQYDRLLGER